eukprot:scaffold151673_cov26-Tisochrysis_lutea.AAC.1
MADRWQRWQSWCGIHLVVGCQCLGWHSNFIWMACLHTDVVDIMTTPRMAFPCRGWDVGILMSWMTSHCQGWHAVLNGVDEGAGYPRALKHSHHPLDMVFAKFDDVGEPSLIYPPAYTSCVQQLDNGAWMFPCWEPEPADAAQQADSAPGSHGDHGSSVSGRGDVHAGESGHGQGSGGGQQKERGKAPGGGPPVTKGAHGAAQQAVSAPAESGGR